MFDILDAAIALFSLCLVTAVYVWQSGRTERQRMAIGWERERYIASQHADSKRWEEADAARKADTAAVIARCDKMEADLKRFVEGREVIRRAG